MPDPTSTAATIVASAVVAPSLTAFGVPLGLSPPLLVAGFAGSVVGIILLNTVPSTGDTWRELIRSSVRRMAVAAASSLTAGYLTPLVANETWLLGAGFMVGVGAQTVLASALAKFKERFDGRIGGDQA